MVADGSPIRYACVARSGIILAGLFSGGDATSEEEGEELAALAERCVEKAPAYHRHYSHTARGTTYSFVMEGPFVFFAVHGGSLRRDDGLRFLGRVKSAFLKSLKTGPERLAAGAHQTDFGPVLRYLMQMPLPPTRALPGGHDDGDDDGDRLFNRETVDVPCGEAGGLFGRPVKYEKIRRSNGADAGGDLGRDAAKPAGGDDDVDDDGECESLTEKDDGLGGDRERARRVWRRHVKVVLVIDFLVCLVLFGVWLSICKGFHCVNR